MALGTAGKQSYLRRQETAYQGMCLWEPRLEGGTKRAGNRDFVSLCFSACQNHVAVSQGAMETCRANVPDYAPACLVAQDDAETCAGCCRRSGRAHV